MALQRIKSENISIFPSSMRTGYDVYSRFTTELNLVNILNRIADTTSYVSRFENDVVEFTLGGYYFNTTLSNIKEALSMTVVNPGDEIYVVAMVNYDTNEIIQDTRLVGYDGALQNTLDMNDKFLGLQFTTSESDITTLENWIESQNQQGQHITLYKLKLFECIDQNILNVPEDSTTKILSDSIDFDLPIITDEQIHNLFTTP